MWLVCIKRGGETECITGSFNYCAIIFDADECCAPELMIWSGVLLHPLFMLPEQANELSYTVRETFKVTSGLFYL